MKVYIACLFITTMLICETAFAAVGEASISDSASGINAGQSMTDGSFGTGTSYQTQAAAGSADTASGQQWYGSRGSVQDSGSQVYGSQVYGSGGSGQASGSSYSGQTSSYSAPQISGPAGDQMTAEDLGLSVPQMESFVPDESLGFVSASPSTSAGKATQTIPVQSSSSQMQYSSAEVQYSAQAGSQGYNWYYPGQVSSANRFYIETSSGFRTAAGCSLYGYLPLWSDIRSGGNFFVYEWYPGRSSPSVRWWGWTEAGWKKGWFFGDQPGWHILCYNSGFWSNYIYIYVYPTNGGYSGTGGYTMTIPASTMPIAAKTTSAAGTYSTGTYSAATTSYSATLPSGAPVPPDPSSERISLPDYSQYRPVSTQMGAGSSVGSSAGQSVIATMPASSAYGMSSAGLQSAATAGMGSFSLSPATSNPALAGYAGTGGSSLASASFTSTSCTLTSGSSQPEGYVPHSYQAVYPLPSVCKCNEYYVQVCTGKLGTVAGVFCEDSLPLWSKLSRSGEYWSFEWTACGSGIYNCWTPEAKSFGYKKSGWHQTWFKGNKPGWHILSYHCNDWSNYIYIYVWPAE